MRVDSSIDDEIILSESEFELYKLLILHLNDEDTEILDNLLEKVMYRAEKEGYKKFLTARLRG